MLLAYGVSGVCGLQWRSRLPFVVRHPFPVSVGPSPFLGLGWFGHRWPLLRLLVLDSSDARLHCPDTLALTVMLLPSLAVGWPRPLLFLGLYLGFFPLASSVGCWLEVVVVYP